MKRENGKKLIVFLVVAVLAMAVMLSACQPTPDTPPVVNKRDSEEAMEKDNDYAGDGESKGDTGETIEGDAISSKPVEYEVSEHWKEEIKKDDKFVVQADVDVEVPKVDKLPSQKIVRNPISQETVEKLVEYFTKDEDIKLYKWPLERTKADFQDELVMIKKDKAQADAEGYGDDPYYDERIQTLEAQIKKAPEKAEIEYVDDLAFTYQTDYETGKPYKNMGENFLNVAFDLPDSKSIATIYASQYAKDKSVNAYFSYSTGDSDVEFYYEDNMDWVESEKAWIEQIEDPAEKAERKKELDESIAENEKTKAAFDNVKVDMDKMEEKAIEILEEIGISGVQITQSSKALVGPTSKESMSSNYEWKQPTGDGAAFEFTRACGGIPCARSNSGFYAEKKEDIPESTYAPPFYMETGTLILDKDGNVINLWWNDPAEIKEVVAQDSKILPFDDVKQRAVDHLFYANTYHYTEDYPYEESTMNMRYEVESVKLGMAYTSAKNDIDAALIVPAWEISFMGYYIDTHPEWGSNGKEMPYNNNTVLVNALDGSIIIEPVMQYDESMYDLEYEPGETPEPIEAEGETGGGGVAFAQSGQAIAIPAAILPNPVLFG